ncbi:MAG: anhydro-N-acetylmuramic acid kinase [Flavobacteriaceae bacterium]|nr:anhydro-N-acetylmuramic acid kinase [Flavobacteriaceae bacterium]
MENKIWHIIGLMSGTSLDGVDLVYVKFSKKDVYVFEILEKESVNYSEKWKNTLQAAFDFSGEKLTKLDVDYGGFLGELINEFIVKKKIKNIDFIASHGHTIFHQPELNYTLQIGSGAVIAAETNCKVICDFRIQDVALNGQGAPLVPIGDKLLFSDYDFCLNLGGFANISFEDKDQRVAFDICPVNIVLNHYTRQIGLEYDDKGALAAQGEINDALFNVLNGLPFYKYDQPKSLGYEFVAATVLPKIEAFKLPLNTVLKTFIEHVAFQISEVINRNVTMANGNVLVTGGGAYNEYLIERISKYSDVEIMVPDKDIIDFKEALIFAFLGLLKDNNEVNCLQSVTGAMRDHSSGVVFEF